MKILIVGATGTVGTEIVSLLKKKGHEAVRTTSQEKLAADQVHLNLLNGKGLKAAFKGIDRAFFLSPPGHVNQNELLIPLIDEAKAAGVKKVVLMTAMGANAVETAPLRQVELHLEKSGLSFNIIRPNWFMQNFHTYWMHGIQTAGKILLPVGNAKGSFIDARDIAAVAAELLAGDKFAGEEFDLTGAKALNHDEVAAILSQVTGKKIVYEEITPAAMLEGLVGAGLPKAYAEFMLMILDFFKQGYAERTTDAVKKITGKDPLSFEQYARDYKQEWLK